MKTITVSPETLYEARAALAGRVTMMRANFEADAALGKSDDADKQRLERAQRAYDELERLMDGEG